MSHSLINQLNLFHVINCCRIRVGADQPSSPNNVIFFFVRRTTVPWNQESHTQKKEAALYLRGKSGSTIPLLFFLSSLRPRLSLLEQSPADDWLRPSPTNDVPQLARMIYPLLIHRAAIPTGAPVVRGDFSAVHALSMGLASEHGHMWHGASGKHPPRCRCSAVHLWFSFFAWFVCLLSFSFVVCGQDG